MRGHCFPSLMRGMQVRTRWHINFYVFSDRMEFTSLAGPGRVWSMWFPLVLPQSFRMFVRGAVLSGFFLSICCLLDPHTSCGHSQDSCTALLLLWFDCWANLVSNMIMCTWYDLIWSWKILFLLWSCAESSSFTWAKFPAEKVPVSAKI